MNAQITKCFCCGIQHKSVEACGIYYCPNPACQGSGATWFRYNLKSYKDIENNKHTIDKNELLVEAMKYADSLNDKYLKDYILEYLKYFTQYQNYLEKEEQKEGGFGEQGL